jgi:hypothetical protein
VASKVGFGEQVQPGDAARLRKLMPHRIADDAEPEIADDLFAHAAKRSDIAKAFRRTTLRVHQPLSAKIHDDSLNTPLVVIMCDYDESNPCGIVLTNPVGITCL